MVSRDRTRRNKDRPAGPALVRPLARYAFMALATGFLATAAGQDPIAVVAGVGRWIIASTIGATTRTEVS